MESKKVNIMSAIPYILIYLGLMFTRCNFSLEEIAKGDANKVFIPFEATSALSSLGAAKEMFKDDNK